MFQRMFQFRVVEQTNIRPHLDEFNKLMINMKNVNKALLDEKQGTVFIVYWILLSTLPFHCYRAALRLSWNR